jgi:hypothetical protein
LIAFASVLLRGSRAIATVPAFSFQVACPAISAGASTGRTIEMDEWDKWVQARDRQVSLSAYTDPPAGMYSWENDVIPFGGLGPLPGTFAVDGF